VKLDNSIETPPSKLGLGGFLHKKMASAIATAIRADENGHPTLTLN
jgi:hypothetical protein